VIRYDDLEWWLSAMAVALGVALLGYVLLTIGGCASPGQTSQIDALGDVVTRQEQAAVRLEAAGLSLQDVVATVQVSAGSLVDATDALRVATTQAASQSVSGGSAESTQVGGFLNTVGGDGVAMQAAVAVLIAAVSILWWQGARHKRLNHQTRLDAAAALGRRFR